MSTREDGVSQWDTDEIYDFIRQVRAILFFSNGRLDPGKEHDSDTLQDLVNLGMEYELHKPWSCDN